MDNRFTIRLARPEDGDALAKIYAHYVKNTAVTYEYEPPTAEEFSTRISHVLEKYPYLLAEENGIILGYAYAGTFIARAAADWSVETTVYLAPEARGQGIGRWLYEALEQILWEQGIVNLNAAIAVPSPDEDEYLSYDSMKFHSRMGYSLVGRFNKNAQKFGRWYDLIWMDKRLSEPRKNCPHPKTLDEVRPLIAEKHGIR